MQVTQQPYGTPGAFGASPGGPPRTDTKAILALVLAVLAWTPTVPFIGAIGALIVAHYSERDIIASGGTLGGRSLLTWARVLSWLHLAFCAALFLFVVLAIVGVFSFTVLGLTVG